MPRTDSGSAATERKALELVHARAKADVRAASPQTGWNVIAASRFRLGQVDVKLPPLGVPAFGVNYGEALRLERTLNGHRISGHVTQGDLAILPPDADTRWVFDKTGDVVLVYLSRDMFDRAVEEGPDRDPRSVEIVPQFLIRDLTLERIAHQLLGEISAPRPGSRLCAETLAQELAAHFIGAHSNLSLLPQGQPRTMTPNKLRRAEEFIHANLGSEMRLQDIADAAEMSLFHFAKSFKQATGVSPHQFVKRQRLHHARTLLHDASLSIGEVAEAVGLTHSYFTAVFAQGMGMTPTRFRGVLQL
jgi:AraC family transcriptional regulator